MTRNEARELVMQLLFQMEAHNDYSNEIQKKHLDDNFTKGGQRKYAEALSTAIITNLDEIDKKIDRSSHKWSTKRMPKVDLAITRLAAAEIIYLDDIPDAVAINEAVDMIKKYSDESSKKFINGVLGQVARIKDEVEAELAPESDEPKKEDE
ncbi:MAG: transcription antitermination factor NusB [Anaerovoracaceae bacterium]